jgi:hypothetical protein
MPPVQVHDLVVDDLNAPLVDELNSFTFDDSHFPHMSLVHTFIHPRDITTVCKIVSHIAANVPEAICRFMHAKEASGSVSSPPVPIASAEVAMTLPLDFVSSGPHWEGDDHLPYIALRNQALPAFTTLFPGEPPHAPLAVDKDMCSWLLGALTASQLVRGLHDALMAALAPYVQHPFADEDLAHGPPSEDAARREQGCWYTGGGLVAAEAATSEVDGVSVAGEAGADTSAGRAGVYKCSGAETGAEQVNAATMRYSARFHEDSRGDKFNPHITLGSGEPEPAFALLAESVSRACGGEPISRGNGKFCPEIPLKSPVVMHAGTVAIFQLGNNGSCRFPMYKDTLCW